MSRRNLGRTPFEDEIVVIGYDWQAQRDLIWHSDEGLTWPPVTRSELEQPSGRPTLALRNGDDIVVLGSYRPALFGRAPE